MVIDTSAVVAFLLDEPEADAIEAALARTPAACISTGTLLECCIVLEHKASAAALLRLDALLREAEVEVVPFDAAQLTLARGAFRRFGRGRHRAGLNYGDCFSYALAKARAQPLLFKGADFEATDIEAAL